MLGSVIEKQERISPSSSGPSQRSVCSSVPCSARISELPVSGAAQLKTIGATALRPMTSHSIPYSQLVNPGPKRSSGKNRFQSPSSRARRRSSTRISGYGTPGRDLAVERVERLALDRIHVLFCELPDAVAQRGDPV